MMVCSNGVTRLALAGAIVAAYQKDVIFVLVVRKILKVLAHVFHALRGCYCKTSATANMPCTGGGSLARGKNT